MYITLAALWRVPWVQVTRHMEVYSQRSGGEQERRMKCVCVCPCEYTYEFTHGKYLSLSFCLCLSFCSLSHIQHKQQDGDELEVGE